MAIEARDATVEFLTTTRIGDKGQLTVPKEFRKSLGLEAGAPFAVLRLGDGLILLPQQQEFETLCQRISSALSGAGVSASAILNTLPKARRRVFARRYSQSGARRRT